jgi:hypothetical protein
MAQRELFEPEAILKITAEDTITAEEHFKALGYQHADKITDQIMMKAVHIIRVKLRAMGVDIEAEAAAEGMEVNEYIEEMDAFMELSSDLMYAYLKGMEPAMPFPFLN